MKVIDKKKFQRSSFTLNPVAAAIIFAMTAQLPSNVAQANGAFGTNTDISGNTINVPTYYANSPQGIQPAFDLATHAQSPINPATGQPFVTVDTGVPLRKFVDKLPGVDAGGPGVGIPLAIAAKWKNPLTGIQTGDDYYEIAIVEYRQNMHSDLVDYNPDGSVKLDSSGNPVRHGTILRGYVQIETNDTLPATLGGKGTLDAAGAGSEHIPLTYPDGTPVYKMVKDPVSGLMVQDPAQPVYAVHSPSYLGPIIVVDRGTAVRIKYTNYMPYTDASGIAHGAPNGGEMPIPVDEYTDGGGPVMDAKHQPVLDQNGNPIKFSQNRADIHWHGGDTPWISDGTPHQWVAPAGDVSYSVTDATHPNGMGRGDSAQNVPDMPDPGPGSGTLYFPNNLSARLMFYHDHTSGLTKLNVYEGVAAGYVIRDPAEQGLVANGSIPGTLLGVGIPLVIQDKTFVPKNIGAAAVASDGVTPQSQDAKWDLLHWGQPGDLWFPHVYEANQDPNSIDGTNPVGRWDWGPWFWPVFPSQYSLPSGNYGDVTATPEAFMDTAVVNGMAYPTLTVDPVATRFRILSVPNDRSTNLSLYQAVDAAGKVCDATNTSPAMAPAFPGGTAPVACTEVRMVPASPTPGFPATWPTDGRAGGVPDPTTAGPDIIQIGNEAGLLPAPAVWHAQPITYDTNVRSMTIFNVLKHSLLLGAAERADVVVDFSKYAGQTLILYNDAPAPMPGFDPRIDYFTGVGDQTSGGGAYDTPAGYGPNTRTVMQIKVNASVTGTAANSYAGASPTAFDTAKLAVSLPAAYAASQPKPNIPETAYNTAFPGTSTQDNYAQIFTGSKSAPAFSYPLPGVDIGTVDPATGLIAPESGVTVVTGGSGYKRAPTITFSAPPAGGTQATATATIRNGVVTSVTVTNPGSGYLSDPTLTLTDVGIPLATTAATVAVVTSPAAKRIHVINKAIQELFDPVYGRMNATLAVELPFSSATIATTIPLAYIDTPIDSIDAIKDGETQIWKITHNGVDSHPVHFHLVNVQVINRVDWAGVVKPPEANEVGWKETLRMNPLEDVYVAARAVHPVVPFGLPKSERVLDPGQTIGSQLNFTQIDPLTGNAPTFQTQLVNGVSTNVAATSYSNQLTDFDNEYVWHCHILGHEENDFMRPFIFHPNVVVPDAPGKVTVSGSTVTWTDPTPYGGQDAQGIPTAGLDATGNPASSPKNEVGFNIVVAGATVATVPANVTSWTDTTGLNLGGVKVVAFNAAGNSKAGTSNTTTSGSSTAVTGGTAAAAATTAAVTAAATTAATTSATAAATAAAAATATAAANAAADAALAATAAQSAVEFSGANPGSDAGTVSLTWANNPANVNVATGYTNVTGFTITWTGATSGSATATGTPTGATITGLTSGGSYSFSLVANAVAGNSAPVTVGVTAP